MIECQHVISLMAYSIKIVKMNMRTCFLQLSSALSFSLVGAGTCILRLLGPIIIHKI